MTTRVVPASDAATTLASEWKPMLAIIPLMQADAVEHYRWMTDGEFLKPSRFGQATRGPAAPPTRFSSAVERSRGPAGRTSGGVGRRSALARVGGLHSAGVASLRLPLR